MAKAKRLIASKRRIKPHKTFSMSTPKKRRLTIHNLRKNW